MRFDDRREWTYDSDIFHRGDVQQALLFNAEYVKRCGPNPIPKVFEVARDDANTDHLWHSQISDVTQFSREVQIPCIFMQDKTQYVVEKNVLVNTQRAKVWYSHLHLKEFDYFPSRGDQIFWGGYRWMMLEVAIEPQAYWAQTSIWTNLYVNLVISPMGDWRPTKDQEKLSPAEKSTTKQARVPKKKVISNLV
jgi:hypothetical protein